MTSTSDDDPWWNAVDKTFKNLWVCTMFRFIYGDNDECCLYNIDGHNVFGTLAQLLFYIQRLLSHFLQSCGNSHTVTLAFYFLGCIECMRCRLLLPMCVMSVCPSVCQSVCLSVSLSRMHRMSPTQWIQLETQLHCAGSFHATFAKWFWPIVKNYCSFKN